MSNNSSQGRVQHTLGAVVDSGVYKMQDSIALTQNRVSMANEDLRASQKNMEDEQS